MMKTPPCWTKRATARLRDAVRYIAVNFYPEYAIAFRNDVKDKSGHYFYMAASAPTLIAADVHEQKHSPAIDAGDPKSPYKNEPKPCGWRVNLGRYGNTPEAMTSKQGLMLFVR